MEKRVKNELLGLVRAISSLNCARPFLKPVDPVALNIPDYLVIIQKPMDLLTIKVSPRQNSLSANKYSSYEDFSSDFNLMLDNCRRYNIDSYNPVRQMGEELAKQFNIHWSSFMTRRFVTAMQEEESALLAPPPPVKRPPEEPVESKKTKKVKTVRFMDDSGSADDGRQALIEELNSRMKSHAETIQKLKEAASDSELEESVSVRVRFPSPPPIVIALPEPKTEIHEDAPPPTAVELGDYLTAVHREFVSGEAKRRIREQLLGCVYSLRTEH
jgi:bromodomain-containing factor 1